jgi:DNA-binding protein Fis
MNAEDYRVMRETIGSQAKVAAALGINHTTLQRREAGTYKVTQEAESQAE